MTLETFLLPSGLKITCMLCMLNHMKPHVTLHVVALLTACADDFQRSIISHIREVMAATSADNNLVLTEM